MWCLGTRLPSTQQTTSTLAWGICTLLAGSSSQRSTTCTTGACRRSLRECGIAHPTTTPSNMCAPLPPCTRVLCWKCTVLAVHHQMLQFSGPVVHGLAMHTFTSPVTFLNCLCTLKPMCRLVSAWYLSCVSGCAGRCAHVCASQHGAPAPVALLAYWSLG